MDSHSSPFDETVNESAGAKLLRNPWLWVGVFAAGVAVFGAFAFLAQREKRLAREEYDKALKDYLAAGLPDPFAAPAPRGPVPTAAQGNLLFAPVFDGLCVMRGNEGFFANPNAAIRAKADDVGQLTLWARADDAFTLDPSEYLTRKPLTAKFIEAPDVGGSPTRAFIDQLEREFPDLRSLVAIEAAHPCAVMPRPEKPVRNWYESPCPQFKDARATAFVLTAYAGCKALEGDGAPAAAVVCGLCRWFEASDAEPVQTLVGAMINVAVAKISILRLTHLAVREGLWTDEQLRRVGEHLDRVRLFEGVRASLAAESYMPITVLKAAAEGDPECVRIVTETFSGWGGGALQSAAREPGAWRNATAFLRDGLAFDLARNAAGQLDTAKFVALEDSYVISGYPEDLPFFSLAMPARKKVIGNAGLADLRVKSARLACALELYRRAHGAYPEKLDALVPQYLPALPLSPWAGGKVEYAVTPAGYTLTWPKADYYDAGNCRFGGTHVNRDHPGPWEILGEKFELPARIRWFDKVTVTTSVAAPKDIVWTMPAPKNAKVFATPAAN